VFPLALGCLGMSEMCGTQTYATPHRFRLGCACADAGGTCGSGTRAELDRRRRRLQHCDLTRRVGVGGRFNFGLTNLDDEEDFDSIKMRIVRIYVVIKLK
jgi:hypothetical protein